MSFAVRAAALFVALAAVAPIARADTSGAFLDRMRAASGEPYRFRIVSVSHVRIDGATQTNTTEIQGIPYVSRTCVGALCSGDAFDGTTAYAIDLNDTALADAGVDPSFMLGMRTASSLDFLAPDFSRRGTIDDRGTIVVAARAYRKLLVAPTGGDTMAVLVDPATALVASIADTRNADITASYADYRRIGSVVLPFLISHDGQPIERFDSRTVSPGTVVMPGGVRQRIVGGDGLQIDEQTVAPVGTCTIGGLAVRCLIDSGSSGLSMSIEVAERLHLTAVGTFEARGLGTYATEVVRAGPLRAGNAIFGDANYSVLNDIERYGYDLVLGADALAPSRVRIDPVRHRVLFGAPASTDGIVLPLAFENFVPITPVGLNGLSALLALDTGDDATIDLAGAFYDEHAGLFTPAGEQPVAGVGAESVEATGRIAVVTLGGHRLLDQPIAETRTLRGTADGHLGAGFLREFVVTLDYAAQRATLAATQ
jgi:hypothetical protein